MTSSSGMSEKHAQLVEYVMANGRVCPQPRDWDALWEMLPGRRRSLSFWRLGGTLLDCKNIWLLEHLEWAD
jgi:hypothetical protein